MDTLKFRNQLAWFSLQFRKLVLGLFVLTSPLAFGDLELRIDVAAEEMWLVGSDSGSPAGPQSANPNSIWWEEEGFLPFDTQGVALPILGFEDPALPFLNLSVSTTSDSLTIRKTDLLQSWVNLQATGEPIDYSWMLPEVKEILADSDGALLELAEGAGFSPIHVLVFEGSGTTAKNTLIEFEGAIDRIQIIDDTGLSFTNSLWGINVSDSLTGSVVYDSTAPAVSASNGSVNYRPEATFQFDSPSIAIDGAGTNSAFLVSNDVYSSSVSAVVDDLNFSLRDVSYTGSIEVPVGFDLEYAQIQFRTQDLDFLSGTDLPAFRAGQQLTRIDPDLNDLFDTAYSAIFTFRSTSNEVVTFVAVLSPIAFSPLGNEPPVIAPTATPNTGPAPLTVQFAANAWDPEGDYLTYYWDFGDPESDDNISTIADPMHRYASAGSYIASLAAWDGESEVVEEVAVVVSEALLLSTTSATVVKPSDIKERGRGKKGKVKKNEGTVSYLADINLPMPELDERIELKFDGVKLFKEKFSKFERALQGDVYVLTKRDLMIVLDFGAKSLYVESYKAKLKDFDNSDGVSVELKWCSEIAADQFQMIEVEDGLWEYNRGDPPVTSLRE